MEGVRRNAVELGILKNELRFFEKTRSFTADQYSVLGTLLGDGHDVLLHTSDMLEALDNIIYYLKKEISANE